MNSTTEKQEPAALLGAFIGRLAVVMLGGAAIGEAAWLAALELWRSRFGMEVSELTIFLGFAAMAIGGVLGLGEHVRRAGRLPGPGWRTASGYILSLFLVAMAGGIVLLPLLPAGPDTDAFSLPMLSWLIFLTMTITGGHRLLLNALRCIPDDPGGNARADGLFARAEDIFGRLPLEVLALYGGLLPAWAFLHEVVPESWCGSAATGDGAALLVLMMLVNRGSTYPITGGRMALLAGTGLVGGLAALTAAELIGGCTGLVAWMGWDRDTVTIVIAVSVAVLATLISVLIGEACGLEPDPLDETENEPDCGEKDGA